MPGTRCALALCNNNLVDAKKSGKNISFHVFPKDERRKEWILKCRRADSCFNPYTSFICSEHFLPTDFERNLQAELLGIKVGRKLKKTAVPSVKVKVEEYLSEPSTSSSAYASRKSCREAKVQKDSVHLLKHKGPVVKSVQVSPLQMDVHVGHSDETNAVESENCITPLKYKTVYKRKTCKRYATVDVNLLSNTVAVMEKLNDECYLFGEFIAHELRSIRSPSLKMKFKTKVQNAILKFAEKYEQEHV